jgi:hypothetical protein
MKQVCISSTVLNSHITWDCSSIKHIKGLKLHYLDQGMAFWFISYNELDVLILELENLIDRLISKCIVTKESDLSTEYKNKNYKLDLRNDFEWYTRFLIELYNMTFKTRKHNNYLCVFNKSKLRIYDGESIISYLRTHPWLNEEELYNGINSLWRQLRLDKEIGKETMQKGIANLIHHGLIYYNRKKDEFSVTAIGYMYW